MANRGWVSAYLLILVLLCLGTGVSLFAQVAGGTFSGTVIDPAGRSVPKATIVIQNQATGVTNTVPTNTAGAYSVPSLLPGSYNITASMSGFISQKKTGITLTVGANE